MSSDTDRYRHVGLSGLTTHLMPILKALGPDFSIWGSCFADFAAHGQRLTRSPGDDHHGWDGREHVVLAFFVSPNFLDIHFGFSVLEICCGFAPPFGRDFLVKPKSITRGFAS